MEFRVDEPLWLILLVPLAVYFAFTGWKLLPGSKALMKVVYVLRCIACALLIFALAGPHLYQPVNEEQVLFLVDRSASAETAQVAATEWINEALESKETHQATGVYGFAEDFQSIVPISQDADAMPGDWPIFSTGHTSLAQAIELAANSGETDLATRLVVMTDGNETKGSAMDSLIRLESERLEIDVVPMTAQTESDAAMESFETPAAAFAGEMLDFSVTIESNTATAARLVFSVNDEEFSRQEINLAPGENVFNYEYPAASEGLAKFEAALELDNDAFLENNRLFSLTEVEGPPEVLVVNNGEASPIPTLLDAGNVSITELSAESVPQSLSSILQYDSIIFDNVPATKIGQTQMDVIEQAVQQFGTGFMMVGGDQSYGLGGYFKTPIERLLPVEMEVTGKHELPSLGLVLVMDRSGSMSGMKMELAKEAAARSLELLRPDDTVGFIAFDDKPWEVLPLAKLSDQKDAVDTILSIGPGGGTEIYSSLQMAYEQLSDLELQRKHIILLTDGQSYSASSYDPLLEDGVDNNVTLSTIAIGQDADKALLEQLAETGGGRYYDVNDATTIPAILSRETIMMSRTYIVDEPFTPTVYDSPWNSLFEQGVPQMNAYIATTAKPLSTVALESPEEDPVLATWNYGLGKAIAFTSGSGAWSGGFQSWSEWPDFWNRSVSQMLPSYEQIPFSVTRKEQGVYTVKDPTGSSAILDVTVIGERGQEVPVETDPVAPGEVEVAIDADPGLVFFSITNETGAAYRASVTIPYGDEYRIEQTDMRLLTSLAERTGGQVLEEPAQAFRDIPYRSGTISPVAVELLLVAMLLFFIDITLRRFGLKWPRNRKKSEIVQEEMTESSGTIDKLIKPDR